MDQEGFPESISGEQLFLALELMQALSEMWQGHYRGDFDRDKVLAALKERAGVSVEEDLMAGYAQFHEEITQKIRLYADRTDFANAKGLPLRDQLSAWGLMGLFDHPDWFSNHVKFFKAIVEERLTRDLLLKDVRSGY